MAAKKKKIETVIVKAPDMRIVEVQLRSTSCLVSNRFGARTLKKMFDKHAAGDDTSTKKKDPKPPRDFAAEFNDARHVSVDGWDGVPCTSFKNSMVRAASLEGLVMKTTKLAFFVLPDGFSKDGTPLVRVKHPEPPVMDVRRVRNSDGSTDLRARPMYATWEALLKVRYDAQFIDQDSIVHLCMRSGTQVGIGEGRPDSTKSHAGMGWGTFELVSDSEQEAAE